MSRNNKLSSINSKDSLNVVQLPFPIPSSKIQNSENLSPGVLNPKSVSQGRALKLSVEGLRSKSGKQGLEGHALEQGLDITQGPLAIPKRAMGILYSGSKTEQLSLVKLKKRKVLKTLPYFNRSFDKKRLKLLFSWYYANKGENAAFSLVETLQKLGFTYAMKAGISLGVDDLKVPSTKINLLTEAVESLNNTKASVESGNVTALEEFQQFVDTWHRTSENLKTSVIQNFTRGLATKKSLPNSLKKAKIKKPKITSFPSSFSLGKARSPYLPIWNVASSFGASKVKPFELDPKEYRALHKTNQKQSLSKEGEKDPKRRLAKLNPLAQNTRAMSYGKGKQNFTEGIFQEEKVFSLEDSTTVSVQNFSEYKPLLRSYGNNLNPVYMMAFSGARGNLSQVRQLVGMRGLMADPQGQLVEFPIQSNFREGLTVTEYMISCYGARKGLVDTALRTAAAGYLTRRLVDVSHHQIVRSVTCGTKSGVHFPLEVNKEGTEKSSKSNKIPKTKERKSLAFYIGRVLARDIPGVAFRNQEIDTALGSSRHFRDVYENVGIYIRSPLTCKSEIGICQLCYGWSVSANRLVGLGEAVGIIAAQSIGEPGTQLTMRTFHTGGVFSGDIMEECRAKHEGIVCFQGAYLGLMVRTAGGAIAFCLKTPGILQIKGLEKLTKYTLLPNTLLFVRQGEKVGVETLLAQIPNLPEIEESTGESTKTIVSNLSGEVRQTPTVNFELENIRILAGQEYVPFFCSNVLPNTLYSGMSSPTVTAEPCYAKWGKSDGLAPKGQSLWRAPVEQGLYQGWTSQWERREPSEPREQAVLTAKSLFAPPCPSLPPAPHDTARQSTWPKGPRAGRVDRKAFGTNPLGHAPTVASFVFGTAREQGPQKKKVSLIQGSHRIGNHSQTYRQNDFLTENSKFIKYKQKSLPFLGNFGLASKDMVQTITGLAPKRRGRKGQGPWPNARAERGLAKGHAKGFAPLGAWAQPKALTQSKALPTLFKSTSRVLPSTNLPDGCGSFWSESFESGQLINSLFFSKISKLLTKNSFKTGVLLELRCLKVLKKQKNRVSLKASPFAKSLDLDKTRITKAPESTSSRNLTRQEVLVDLNNLNVLSIIKNLPKPKLNKITFLQNKTMNFDGPASKGFDPLGLCGPYGPQSTGLGKGLAPQEHAKGFAPLGQEHTKGQSVNPGLYRAQSGFARQVQKSYQNSIFTNFTPTHALANSLKLNTFFLYKQFFFHQYNTPLLLYKCKNPIDFVGQQTLRKGVVLKTALQKAQALNKKPKLKGLNPYLGIILRSFNSTKSNRAKKSPLVAMSQRAKGRDKGQHQKDFSFFLWWPLNLQESNLKKQKAKFYTFKGLLNTMSITKSIKLSKYSFLFWKISFVIFVKSVNVKKKKSFFLNKRIIKNLQWWGYPWTSRDTTRQSTFFSLGAKLNKKILESSVKRVPLHLARLATEGEKSKEGFWTNSLSLGKKGIGLSANFHQYKQTKEIDLESYGQKAKRLDSLLTSQKTGEIFPIQGNISLNSFQKSYTFWLKSQKKGQRRDDIKVRPSNWLFGPKKAKLFDQETKGYQSLLKELSFGEFYRSNPRTMPQQKGQISFKGASRESRSTYVPRLLTATSIKTNNLILTHNDRVSYNLVNKQSLATTNRFKDYKTLPKKPLESIPRLYQGQSLLELPPISLSKTQTKYFKSQIGYFINIGDELIKNYGSAHCGQIIEKSYSQLTLRFNQNVLYSNLQNRPAVVSKNVKESRWLPSGTSLVTLPYISSVTGDIVAGIPKIEQLFEARGEALEKTVDKMWSSYKTAVVPRAKAVRECFKEIGLFVVAAIQKVYSSQGVQIADKHLEVIIRQMIGRALILDPGDTPFLPDEFVDLQTIERVNWTTYGERASYRPHLVGITKASLTSNSFLSSASFQQTARVLERETFLEKTDRLLGLKERVMMGALINAGTGDFQTGVGLSKVSKTFLRKN